MDMYSITEEQRLQKTVNILEYEMFSVGKKTKTTEQQTHRQLVYD